MTTDQLREAAALMRQRAQAAISPSPWRAVVIDNGDEVWDATDETVVASHMGGDDDVQHIASWHPGVALAVADWLDYSAAYRDGVDPGSYASAVEVARTYLGRDT